MTDQPDKNIGSLAHQSDEPLKIKVGELDLELRPLKLMDFAAAQNHLVSQRLESLLAATSPAKHSIPDAVRAQAIAGIMNNTPDLPEVLVSTEARLYLVWLSAGGKSCPVSFDGLKKNLTDCDIAMLTQIVMQVTGLVEKPGDDDPLVPTETQEVSTPPDMRITASI